MESKKHVSHFRNHTAKKTISLKIFLKKEQRCKRQEQIDKQMSPFAKMHTKLCNRHTEEEMADDTAASDTPEDNP